MRKITFIFALTFAALTAGAQNNWHFEANGNGTCKVVPYEHDHNHFWYTDENGNDRYTSVHASCHSYSGDADIPSTDGYGNTVTAIGSGCFDLCDITSVNIPGTVNTIEANAFKECKRLQRVAIPEGVTTIGDRAFLECDALTSVSLPSTLLQIGGDAFRGLKAVKEFTIPANVDNIGNGAFMEMESLEKLTIADGSKMLTIGVGREYGGEGMFGYNNQPALEEAYIGRNWTVSSYSHGLFEGHDSYQISTHLKKVTIGNLVTAIPNASFLYCYGLEQVTIGSGVETIYDFAFYGDNALRVINVEAIEPPTCEDNTFVGVDKENCILCVPAGSLDAYKEAYIWKDFLNIHAINEQAIDGMFCYIYNHGEKTATLTYLHDSDNSKKGGTYVGDVVIPAKAPNGYDVTVIGEDAFYNCPEMTSLTIPATIDSIGCEPFAESGARLTKITIEDGDTPIRCHVRDAWPMGCYPVFGRYVNVEELYIGRNYSSFVSRGWVEAVYEGSWSLIKDSEHLKKVTLGEVFTEVPYAMFYGCTQLQEVNISPNAKSVGKEAFSRCEALTSIDLPEGIETIDEEAFYYCKALEQIGLPKTLKVIGGNAFTNCDAFSSFTIPASVDSIGPNILADCDNLKRIDIAYSPEPLKYYCPSQFQNALRSAPIDTLYTDRYIDGGLSDNRTLKKLYVGPNVTALHDYNFSDCYNIDEVFSLNPVPPTCEGSSVFYSGTKQNATLHVPVGSLDTYKEAYIWKDFFNIVDDITNGELSEPTLTQKPLFATRLANMHTPRMSHQIMPVEDGFVVFGGHTTGFDMTKTAERYDLATDSWTQMNMLYYQDYSAGIVTADGRMLLAGGMSGGSGTGASAQCELYDPTDNTFTATGSLTQARSMATATMTKSGKIYVNGCWYNSSYGLECYDPETGTFSKVAEGLNAYHPLLLSLRGERVAIAYGTALVVAEDGVTTNVESELLTDYPILRCWDETQMKYYQLADYNYILVGKSGSQAVLLNVYDDATEGVKVSKIADLPMTLPDNESVGIGYYDQATRVFCNNDKRKVYVQTTLVDNGCSPVIVEYDYPSATRLEGGNIVVYTMAGSLEKRIDNAAWTMFPDGTLVSAGGGDSNSAPHNVSYIYNLGDGSEDPDGISDTPYLNDKGQMTNDNAVYDLSGRKIDSSFFTLHSSFRRGIYIVNGKKIVVK
ncbi:MAG: leucine-rich repeat protein [Bacteroidaceae bacterium]|nr:leucine-rich repeat protein [Bacteroidaceae bacterium]